jgi:hypothetical protein
MRKISTVQAVRNELLKEGTEQAEATCIKLSFQLISRQGRVGGTIAPSWRS